jgi:hypothetical protein
MVGHLWYVHVREDVDITGLSHWQSVTCIKEIYMDRNIVVQIILCGFIVVGMSLLVVITSAVQ